jgi:nitroreductase
MKLEFSVEEIVKARCSVRSYTNEVITEDKIEQIKNYISTLSNPFGVKVNFHLLETKDVDSNQKLGTYGVIKGAKAFIGATVADTEFALEALGYEFEKLVLYITSIGLGTCWLGGTFNKNSFANALEVNEKELFPIISPVGYTAEKRRFGDTLARKIAKSDQRKNWGELFFEKNTNTALTKTSAGAYESVLELLRLAPSAANKQPWRVVLEGNTYHFYEDQAKAYSNGAYDIQAVDMGIGACHFHLAAMEKDLNGEFKKLEQPSITTPTSYKYKFSWIPQ